MVPLPDEVLVIHSALDDQQASCYERLLEELTLEHFHEVLYPNIRFLFLLVGLGRRLATGCLLSLHLQKLLLLLEAYLVALLEGELRVLAVDALGVYG